MRLVSGFSFWVGFAVSHCGRAIARQLIGYINFEQRAKPVAGLLGTYVLGRVKPDRSAMVIAISYR